MWHCYSMSIDLQAGIVPEWNTGDRMRKALDVAGVGVGEMAEYLGVNRNTVGTWINGRIMPRRSTLVLWALRTGVPLVWLETGEAPATEDGGPGLSYTSRDLNPEPADFHAYLVARGSAA